MKKILLATVALAALAAPAAAADLAARPTYTKAPVVAPVQTWTGFYIGAMGGYASGQFGGTFTQQGGFVGGTAGYNWQAGAVVYGIEADAAWADINGTGVVAGFPGTLTSQIRDWGTVRGRIGYAFGPTMLYATGGYAWADNRLTSSFFNNQSPSNIHSGWTVGAGVEYMFARNWSLKGEYLYKSFGAATYNYTGGFVNSGNINIHSAQFGINYHF
ncbi:outer membrane protein [Bradyrhizobium sp. HKCCYLS2038]|uniref:outer membrane protein n=1 Tax=unclassified Bradyrhizobium TaxID=2631580 RepID=UPI003EB8F987